MKPKKSLQLAALIVFSFPHLAEAQWNGAGVGAGTATDLSNPANWNPTLNGDFTTINTAGTYNYTLSGDTVFSQLNFAAALNANTTALGTVTGGSGYTSAPAVTFTGGSGTGLAGTSSVTSGVVTSIALSNAGAGYYGATLPAINFGGPGVGAAQAFTGALPTGATDIVIGSDAPGTFRTITLGGNITPQGRSDSSLTFTNDVILELSGSRSIVSNSGGVINAATVINFNGDIRSTAAGSQSFTNNHGGSVNFGAGATVSLDGGYINTAGISTFNGLVTGTGGITNSGGTTNLNNTANDFTGTVSVSAGTINFNSIGNIGVASALGSGDQISIAGSTIAFTGSETMSSNRAIAIAGSGTIKNNGTGAVGLRLSGPLTFSSAGALRLGGTNNEAVNILSSNIPSGTGARTLTINGDTGDLSVWRLTGTNAFTGAITVSRGTLEFQSMANLGAGTSVALSGSNSANLRYIGTGAVTFNRNITYGGGSTNTTSITNNGAGAMTISGTTFTAGTGNTSKILQLTGFNTGDNRITTSIARGTDGTASSTPLTKSGAGTWILSGANLIGASGNVGGVSTITVNNGRLVLDYATNDAWGVASNVTMAGGILEIRGRTGSGNTTIETLGNLSTTSSTGYSQVVVNSNGGDGTTLNLGTISRAAGSAVLFDVSSGSSTVTSSSTLGTDGVFTGGGHILIRSNTSATGVDYVGKSGSNLVALGASTGLVLTGGSSNTNYANSGNRTLSGTVSASTVRTDTTGGGTLDINTRNLLTANGSLYVGTGDYLVTGTTGYLGTSGGTAVVNHYGSGTLTLAARLGSSTGTIFLLNGGSGLIDWTSASNATGGHQFLGGVVRVGAGSIGGGAVRLASGAILELQSDFSRDLGTSAGQLEFVGNSGFSAFGANRTVTLEGGAALTWGSGDFVTDTLLLGSNYSNSTLIFTNALNLTTQSRVVEVKAGTNSNVDGRLSGVVSSSGGGLVKTGAGKLELTAANTYSGDTWVQGGTLLVNNTSGSGTGSGNVRLFSGATLGGTGSISGRVGGPGTIAPGTSPGVLSIAGVDPAEGLDFSFEITALAPDFSTPGGSLNDVLYLTGDTPFSAALTAGNTVTFDFTGTSFSAGDTVVGGFFSEQDISASIAGANYVFIGLDGLTANVGTRQQSVDFGDGLVSGYVMTLGIVPIPEPSSAGLIGVGLAALAFRRRVGRA